MALLRPSSASVLSRHSVHEATGRLLVLGAVAYLFTFLHRGWIPHDEGLLGQSADLVLRGALPHADFDEAYTGGLSVLYAAVFRLVGTDLVYIRWLMWLVFAGCACCLYAIGRRYMAPVAAGLATWVAVTWSFPNYFAGLPSWWLTACALIATWAFMRHVETDRWSYLALAALSVGVAVIIKQTGVYLVLALAMATVFGADLPTVPTRWQAWARRVLAVASVGLAISVMKGRIFDAEGIFLLLPIGAVALPLWHGGNSSSAAPGPGIRHLALVAGVAALPLVGFACWFALHGRLWDLFYGGFVLPRARLSFASTSMPSATLVLAALPLLLAVYLSTTRRLERLSVFWWLFVLAVPAALLFASAYQMVWQAARCVAALLPLVVAWWLCRGSVADRRDARILFMLGATTSWIAMNQFPFGAPIYFSYTVPLVVLTGVALASVARVSVGILMPWTAMLLLFAVVITNRGYVWNLGLSHQAFAFDSALGLSRAHLQVEPMEATVYRRVVEQARVHAAGGRLMAGPDCPEVYFLTGTTSPTGTMYEFMANGSDDRRAATFDTWRRASMIVVNHAPLFSPRFDEGFLMRLRGEFPSSEWVGRFEMRWR